MPETNTNENIYEGIDTNFSIEDEYKPEPLVPPGTYTGAIVDTAFAAGHVRFKFTLSDNGGTMSDGETPIDGATLNYRLWLPKPGDDVEYTASGRQTKRQWKINNMKKVFDGLKLTIADFGELKSLVEDQDLVGVEIRAAIDVSEFKGNISNDVNSIVVI